MVLGRNGVVGRFRHNRSGGVAVTFGLVLIPLLIAAGIAIDYGRASSTRITLQAALDAAALSAASAVELSTDERVELGKTIFQANLPDNLKGNQIAPEINFTDTTVSASVDMNMPTSVLQVAGISTMDVGAAAEIPILPQGKAEVVLVLDYSDSMFDNDKYIQMRDAAKSMVERLTSAGDNRNIRFGIVPFAAMVYTDLPSSYVRGAGPTGIWTGCTQDRRHPHNTTADAPDTADDATKWGELVGYYAANPDQCDLYPQRDLKVLPLSDDFGVITSKLDAMTPHALTHIALGLEFGWHVVSPNAPFTEGVAYSDTDTLKVIVLLTDGMQTARGWGSGDSSSVENAEDNLEDMCEAIKDDGIHLFTISFDLTESDTNDRLEDCASPSQYFVAGSNDGELQASFDQIGARIKKSTDPPGQISGRFPIVCSPFRRGVFVERPGGRFGLPGGAARDSRIGEPVADAVDRFDGVETLVHRAHFLPQPLHM